MCGPDGERDKIPHPPKVPSGSHQCYSHLCFWAIFYITIYILRFIFHFLINSRGTPFSLFDYFPCYPLHFIRFLLYLYFTFYFSLFDSFTWYPLQFIRFYLPVTPFVLWGYFMENIISFILKYIIFIYFEIYHFYLF